MEWGVLMARYIDENKIKFNGFTFEDADKEVYIRLSDVRQAIAQTPTEDVVEVVRCEKCKYGDVSTFSMTKDGQEEIACYCNLKKKVTDVDSYCPSGERK